MRQIVKHLKQISMEIGYDFITYGSDDWILEIQHIMLIHGYSFPNNNSSVALLCSDKSACYQYLQKHNVNSVPHYFIDRHGCDIKALAEDVGYPLILKNNNGTGGRNVYKIINYKRLKYNIDHMWKMDHDVCVSPFIDIINEYRVIMLNFKPMLCYRKQRPYIIGDGVSTKLDLIKRLFNNDENMLNIYRFKKHINEVLPSGVSQLVTWKHNLSRGSSPEIINIPNENILSIAKSAVKALGICFCSVDIIETTKGFFVLEVNSGVMMERLSQSSTLGYQMVHDIYKAAVVSYFTCSEKKYC